MGLADDRKSVNLMTVHVSKSVTVHGVSNNKKYGLKYIVLRYMDVFEARQDYRSFTGV